MAEEIRMDFDRVRRIGLTEAVFCHGKTIQQISAALGKVRDEGVPLLLTRLDEDTFQALDGDLRAAIDYDVDSRTGVFGDWSPPLGQPRVAIVTAGTSDLGVAREAARTLAFHGWPSREIADVGVAGLWRVLAHEQELRCFPVVIVVAGMDGALFSVLGGLTGGVVIAVPTSTGYGAARRGRTALDSALASCAPGLVAVNIDNGYGGACAALRVLHALDAATKASLAGAQEEGAECLS
jgi:NCAIR mutase (PurE)-related protein